MKKWKKRKNEIEQNILLNQEFFKFRKLVKEQEFSKLDNFFFESKNRFGEISFVEKCFGEGTPPRGG